MRASAFVPAHISGFFQPCEAENPSRAGSRNCGPCLDVGVITEVVVEPFELTSVSVIINGVSAPNALTTRAVADRILSAAGGLYKVEINHSCQIPVGAGYGASGAGALGAALALSKALGLSLTRDELVSEAHVAEVTCRTGLGDVGAQAIGGLVMGTRPGGPPYGRWERIAVPPDLKVVCATLGPLSTKSLLGDENFKRRATKLGKHAINRLTEQPTLGQFIDVSKDFAEKLGLLDDELMELIQVAEEAGALGASQVMLGRSVFALVKKGKLEAVRGTFLELLEQRKVMVASIAQNGAKIMG